MRNAVLCIAMIMLSGTVTGQWKAQTAKTYDKTYRIAYVTSLKGDATLRVLRDVTDPQKKGTSLYDKITGQILLNERIDKNNRVQSLVFMFDDSPKMYINQPAGFKQEWDNGSRRYLIESAWSLWRTGDTRDKEVRIIKDPESIPQAERAYAKEVIDLLKARQKVHCRIVMLNEVYGTQSTLDFEFKLQNSTKSINYLFQ